MMAAGVLSHLAFISSLITASLGMKTAQRNIQDSTSTTTMKGNAIIIQCTKETEMPASPKAPTAIALGGVPTGVPMPPTFAASGIARASPARALPRGRTPRMGITTVNMVAVVAVLDMNMDSTAVMSISPRVVMRADSGKGRSITAARLWSRPYFSAPSAIMKPPMNRIITGFARVAK